VQGEICDIEGRCVDAAEDELFKLTTKGGKLTLEREKVTTDTSDFDAGLIFEQDPVQILDALLPLYLNSTLLRSLQVLLACIPFLSDITLRLIRIHGQGVRQDAMLQREHEA
jgi:F-type H+-transporting ATPase subunit gamma